MVENCSLPCLVGEGRLRWFECAETKIQAAVAQLEISEQQAPGAFKALIAGLCCPGASIRADAQPGSWRLVRGRSSGAGEGPPSWPATGLVWKPSPALRAARPVLERLRPRARI